jgi:predicted HTH domain antitoxin
VTLARAAREAGVSLWGMMDYVASRKITAQYDLEDIEREFSKPGTHTEARRPNPARAITQ